MIFKRILVVFALACLYSNSAQASSAVMITVDTKTIGAMINPNFDGLSYEMALVTPANNGAHFFTPTNRVLVKFFETLGIRSLRVGGNTSEKAAVKLPDKSDVDSLFAFAKAADVKVIYTLRLSGRDTNYAAETAKYIMDYYRPELACFAIGNEPEKMETNYAAYHDDCLKFATAITVATGVSNGLFCGPGAMQKEVNWANDFAGDFAGDQRIAWVTQHEYPAFSGRVVTNTMNGCLKLLSTNLVAVYERFYESFASRVLSNDLHYKLEEANSFSNGGAAGASDAFASALWGLDYLYWWASHGADGINLHTGGYAKGGHPTKPMNYAVFWNSANGYLAHPLAYGIKAFDLGCHGHLVPVSINPNTNHINLKAYSVLGSNHCLYITVINQESACARGAEVTFATGVSCNHAECVCLKSPDGDIRATSGTTLGGAAISVDGNWNGTWSSVGGLVQNGGFSMEIPAATAAVLRLTLD